MNVSDSSVMDFIVKHSKGFGSLFYIVNPYESMFEKEEDIPTPNYTQKVKSMIDSVLVLIYSSESDASA